MKLPSLKLPRQAEKRNPIIGVMLGVLIAVVFGLCYHDAAKKVPGPSVLHTLMNGLEYKTYDMRFLIRGMMDGKYISKDIVLLDYDDETQEWAPFPPDRTYYAEIIRALGEEGSRTEATFFDIFFFDPFGRQLEVDMVDDFQEMFTGLPAEIEQDAELTGELKTKMYSAYEKLSGRISAVKINQAKKEISDILANEALRTGIEYFVRTGTFLEEHKDLHALAPDRDIVLHDAIEAAGNVYLAQIVNEREKTPYDVDDILYDKEIHDTFAKLIQLGDRTQTKTQTEVLINATISNLSVQDYKKLLRADKAKPGGGRKPLGFSKKEKTAIKNEMMIVKEKVDIALKLNSEFGFDIPRDAPVSIKKLKKSYKHLINIVPLNAGIVSPAAGIGYVKPEFQETDGVIRMAAPVFFFQDRLYPHISLMLAMKFLDVKKEDVEFYRKRIVLKNAKYPDKEKRVNVTIPLYKGANVLVNWAGKFYEVGQYHHRSFRKTYENAVKYNIVKKAELGEPLMSDEQATLDALSPGDIEKIEEEIRFFDGKLGLTGLTAATTHDVNPIAFHPRYPLVGMHANLVNTILNGLFIRTTPFLVFMLVLLVLGVAIGYVGGTAKQLPGALATIGTLAAYALISYAVFALARLWLPYIPVLFTLVFVYLVVLVYRFMTEGHEARRMKGMFATYVNPEVVETLIHNPEMLQLGGERMELTAMFCLAGGNGLETESAEELVDRLNEFFTSMTEQIFKYDGTLDKYEGKIIMAIFGAPVHYEDHAAKACLTCVGMKKSLAELTEQWKANNQGLIHVNLGLNSGPMIAGNMGSASRFNYTIMGDSVNVSARILGVAIQYGMDFMISEQTYEAAKEQVVARMVDNVVVVGKVEPVKIYQILGSKEETLPDNVVKGMETYEKAYRLHCDRKWDEAIEAFNAVNDYFPDDGPSRIFIQRCEGYKSAPPTDDWIGEFKMTKKGL